MTKKTAICIMKALLWMMSSFFSEIDLPACRLLYWIIWLKLFPTSTIQRKMNNSHLLEWKPLLKGSMQGLENMESCHAMFLSYPTIALWSGGLITGWWLSRLLRDRGNNPNRLPLPPGPRGYPVIGNLFDVTTDKLWKVFDNWSKTFGTSCIERRSTHSLHGINRRYSILQDTRAAISCSRERGKDLWFIRETLVELLWSPGFSHA